MSVDGSTRARSGDALRATGGRRSAQRPRGRLTWRSRAPRRSAGSRGPRFFWRGPAEGGRAAFVGSSGCGWRRSLGDEPVAISAIPPARPATSQDEVLARAASWSCRARRGGSRCAEISRGARLYARTGWGGGCGRSRVRRSGAPGDQRPRAAAPAAPRRAATVRRLSKVAASRDRRHGHGSPRAAARSRGASCQKMSAATVASLLPPRLSATPSSQVHRRCLARPSPTGQACSTIWLHMYFAPLRLRRPGTPRVCRPIPSSTVESERKPVPDRVVLVVNW